jgi:DME family drug/metabolite transporter
VAAYQVTFFAAVDTAGVALGTAVAIGSSPVFTGLIEWATGGGRPAGRWWLATAVGATGVAVLAGPSQLVPAGVALALAAGASYATYAVAAKRLLDSGLSSPSAMAVVFGVGGVLLLPVLPAVELAWLGTANGLVMLGWLAVATILLAYLLFGAGLRLVPAATAATLSLAEPLTAAVLGVLVLGERLSLPAVIGAGLVLTALLVVVAPSRRRPVPAPG